MTQATAVVLEIIELLETARIKMETARTDAVALGLDARQLAIAITDCESSQLRVANAKEPDR